MRRPHAVRHCFVVLVSAMLLAALATPLASEGKGTTRAKWCGSPTAADSLCKATGAVVAAAPGKAPRQAAKRRVFSIVPGTTIKAVPRSVAKLTFGRQARCQLGPISSLTEIVTRAGDADSLFLQRNGISFCTFGRSSTVLPFFCNDMDARCRVLVYVDGTSQTIVHTSNPVVIDLCAGEVSVRIERDFGLAEGSVGAPGSDPGRVRITLLETDSTIELTIDKRPSPGMCDSPIFGSQRRSA